MDRKLIVFFLSIVRLPRQVLNLNLGLGSGQPRNDAGNTHATVIKGPLGLGTLTISHTHGNAGGTKQPNPSSTGSPVKDPSAPAIHNTTQPDCMKNLSQSADSLARKLSFLLEI